MNKKGVDRNTMAMIVLIIVIVVVFMIVWLKLRGVIGGISG